jgi:hypothetical protein
MKAPIQLAGLSFAALAALTATTPSCTEPPIVLASVPSTDAGSPATPVRCVDSKSCPAGSYCSKATCSSTTGSCALFPAVCGQDENPVCGCDSVTYYNPCLSQAAGVPAYTPSECPFDNTTPCGGEGSLACPDPTTQSCALLVGSKGQCPDGVVGTCWVLPATCPTGPDGADQWDACDGSEHCANTCEAIRSGNPYRRASQCPAPPGGS